MALSPSRYNPPLALPVKRGQDLSRRAIGIEISEEYCEIAVRRLRQQVLPLGGV